MEILMEKDQNKKKILFVKDKDKKEFAKKMKSEIIKRGKINKKWADKHLIVMM